MAFVLTIGERRSSWAGRGPLVTIHESREAAQTSLLDWVRESWRAEIGEAIPEGKSGQELIEEFFDYVPQYYEISETADETSETASSGPIRS